MKADILNRVGVIGEAIALIVAWTAAWLGAHFVAAHSECVAAYASICAWWIVLFVCSKLEPKQRSMFLALIFWLCGSGLDLGGHYGVIYPRSIDLLSAEAMRMVVLNGVFYFIVPFYVNRASSFGLIALNNCKRGRS
jgi:hypothetical protein